MSKKDDRKRAIKDVEELYDALNGYELAEGDYYPDGDGGSAYGLGAVGNSIKKRLLQKLESIRKFLAGGE